ncbi:MAG: LysM peptidoglycan-binding domain-containing protein, partial [Angustibacter sp.]
MATAQTGSSLGAQLELSGTTALGPKVYTVQQPDGSYHDNLWDIAEKHLGDGRRYREIHDLNVGRAQADGRQLELSRLIQPGWQLVMPEDATGVPRVALAGPGEPSAPVTVQPPPPAAEAPAQAPKVEVPQAQAPAAPIAPPASIEHRPAEQPPRAAPVDAQLVPAASAETPSAAERPRLTLVEGLAEHRDLSLGLGGAGLLAAGLLVALRRLRRRPTEHSNPALAEAEVALRVGADLNRRRALDLTLRDLAAACAGAELPLPQIFAVRTADDQVELLLAPAAPTAPPGWEALAEGSCWRGPLLTHVEAQSADQQSAGPFPTL